MKEFIELGKKGRTKGKKWTKVKGSADSFRRNKHEVSGYTMKCSEPHRIKAHLRRPRRTNKQIAVAEKRKKKTKKVKKVKKQNKQKTLSGSSPGTPKKYFKQVEKRQSKISTKGK